ncbi:hypothetical protein D3C74_453960 [compost metagenome]
MAPVRMNGRKVRVAFMALGSMCRRITQRSCRPRARAASTYSRLRPRRNSARTTSTRASQENSAMMPSNHQKFGSTKPLRMISR